MKRRAVIVSAVIASSLGIGALAFLYQDTITLANWQKIHIGMSLEEVELIVGRSGQTDDDYISRLRQMRGKGLNYILEPAGPFGSELQLGKWYSCKDTEKILVWKGRCGTVIAVRVNTYGRVTASVFKRWRLCEPSLENCIRAFLLS